MTVLLYPGPDVYPSDSLYLLALPTVTLPSTTAIARRSTVTLLFGQLRGGRITDSLDVTGCNWAQVLNGSGSVDQVTVAEDEVRAKDLRQTAPAARSFLAVDIDGRIQEAGPIWSRVWDYEKGVATLGAGGLWSLFDYRKVIPVLAAGQRVQDATTTVSGVSLGGIARALVQQAMTHVGGDLPIVFSPVDVTGDHTETFPGWKLLTLADQLRELTQRERGAPDIRFQPRYTADKLGIEWVMEVGTEASPLLTQVGEDWYFDASVPKSPVVGISADEDATVMGERAWVTGNGMEENILIASAYDPALVDLGWPLLEVDESRSTVEEQSTLDGHAENLRDRSARPVEVWKVVVRKEAAAEVLAGHYCRVVTKNDAWWGTGEAFMRVKRKSGGLGDNVTLEMYETAAVL